MCNNVDKIYNIFYQEYRTVFGKPIPATLGNYKPHNAFQMNSKTKAFEKQLPYLLAVHDYKELNKWITEIRVIIKSFSGNYEWSCRTFLNFLEEVIEDRNNKLFDLQEKLGKCYQIDGTRFLIELLGGEKEFIKKAVAETYFFDETLVEGYLCDFIKKYEEKEALPARYSGKRVKSDQKGKRPIIEQGNYEKCLIDNGGNNDVKKIIKEKTLYTFGKNSILVNYKISHVWGEAQNPRYFTNLWNIALVPAWANDLLDKETAHSGTIESKMINTYRALCMKRYSKILTDDNLRKIGLDAKALNVVLDSAKKDDVVSNTYTFNVIGKKKEIKKDKTIDLPGAITSGKITI